MTDHFLRISENSWRKLRHIGYIKEKRLKTVIEDIMNGDINPSDFNKNPEAEKIDYLDNTASDFKNTSHSKSIY